MQQVGLPEAVAFGWGCEEVWIYCTVELKIKREIKNIRMYAGDSMPRYTIQSKGA